MAKITYARRKSMKATSFVFPKGTKAAPGKKKFPIHDKAHARQALSRAGQKKTKLTHKERCRVVKVVCKRYPDIGMCAGKSKPRGKKLACGI